VSEPTCSQLVASRDAASLIFNLPGYRVIDAADLPLGGRRVRVETEDRDDGCPDCGVISTRVHAWSEQRVKDIPTGGEFVEVVVRKPRLVCVETECSRRTFTQRTEQLPARARCLTRLRQTLLDAVIALGALRAGGRHRARGVVVDGADGGRRRDPDAARRRRGGGDRARDR